MRNEELAKRIDQQEERLNERIYGPEGLIATFNHRVTALEVEMRWVKRIAVIIAAVAVDERFAILNRIAAVLGV